MIFDELYPKGGANGSNVDRDSGCLLNLLNSDPFCQFYVVSTRKIDVLDFLSSKQLCVAYKF